MEQGEMTSRCMRSSGMPAAAATIALIGSACDTATMVCAGVLGHQAEHGVHGAHRHLGEGLAAGKAEPAGPALHGGPLRGPVQPGQRLLGPVAHVDLDEAGRGPHPEAERLGDRGRRLAGALERRGVDGGRGLGQGGDALGRRGGLRVALLGEVQPGAPGPGASCRWWG